MADLYYYESGYFTPENYYGYLADAQADLSPYAEDYFAEDYTFEGARATLSCSAVKVKTIDAAITSTTSFNVTIGSVKSFDITLTSTTSVTSNISAIRSADSTMSSEFTQTAMISHIEGVDLFAMSNASLAAEVSRIRDNNISASSAFTIATDASRTRNYSSEDAADFTIAIANQRVRFNEAALDAAFSLTADNLRNKYADSAISSTSSVDVIGLRLKSFTSDLTTSSTFTCDAEEILGGEVKEASADLSSASSITVENSRLRSVAVALSTAVTQTSTIDGTLQAQASLTTTINLSATISHIEGADLSAFTNAALSSQAVKITDTSANVLSDASTSTQANRLRDVIANLSTAVTQQTDANRLRDVVAELSTTTTVSADVNETVQLSAELSSAFTQTATISHIEGADLSAFTDSSLAVGADRLRDVTAAINTAVTLNVLASTIQVTTVSLSSAFAQTTSATRIQANSINLSSAFTQSVTGAKFTNFFTIEIQDQPDITNQWYSNPRDLYVDASGNMYSSGGMGTGSTGYTMYPSLTKVNKFGEHQWTKTFITSASDSFTNIVVDSSGNLYTLVNGSNTIIKYNTDGTVVWRYNTSNTTVQFIQIAIDTSDNIIAVGGYTFSSAIQGYVVKINSAGALQWNKRITGDALWNVIVDGTNIYTNNRTSLIKLDSTGAHVWTRRLSRNGSNTTDIYSLGKDSSGNIYAAPLNSGSWYMLVKYDSSGNKLWHRDYSGRVHDVYDSGTDVFILTAEGVGNIDPSNGSVIWNKSYGISGDYFYTDSPETSLLVSNDGLYYTGLRVGNINPYEYSSLILRFPTDGSGIPTFGTYTVNALTDTTTSTTSIVTTAATVTNLTGITLTTNTTTLGTKTPIVTFNAVNPGGYTLNGAASIASTSTLTGALNVVKLATATISTSSSITAQADNNLKSTTASLSANGFVVAAFGRIRPELAGLDSAFSLTAVIGVQQSAQANLASSFSLSAQGQDLDLAQASLTSQIVLTATTRRIARISQNITSNFVLSCDPIRYRATAELIISDTQSLVHFNSPTLVDVFSSGTITLNKRDTGGNITSNITPTFISGGKFNQTVEYQNTSHSVFTTETANINLTGANYAFETWYRHAGDNTDYGYADGQIFSVSGGNTSVSLSIYDTTSHTGINNWGLTNGRLYVNYSSNTISAPPAEKVSSVVISPGVWTHFLFSRIGTTYRLFVNGVLNLTWTDTFSYTTSTSVIRTGQGGSYGYYDELRLRKGISITSNFAVQTEEYYPPNPQYYVNGYALLNTTASLTASFLKVKFGNANVTSQFSQASAISVIRRTNPALTATSTAVIIGQKNAILASALTTTATLVSPINRRRPGQGNLTSVSTMVINAVKRTVTASTITSTSLVEVNNTRTRDVTSQQSTEFTTIIDAIKTSSALSDLTAFYTELAVAFKNATGTILLESTSTLTCAGVITADQPQYLFSQAQMSTTAWNVLYAQSSISATSTFILVPTYLRRNESVMTVTASVTANNSRTRNTASTQLAQFFAFPSTDNSKITGYTAALTAASQMTTNNQILRLAQANMLSTSAMPLAFVGILVRFEANLQVNGFQLTAIDVINIDLFYQLKIPSETRTLWIEPESRILSIDSETRVNKIKGYPTP